MLLRPAMKVIAARNKTSQSLFISCTVIMARNKSYYGPQQNKSEQFSVRQILNCLHSLRPVIDVIAARNKGGSEPEFAIFRDFISRFRGGIKRELLEHIRGGFFRQNF